MTNPRDDQTTNANTSTPEQASHNLEHADHPQQIDTDHPPTRDVGEADFAAEAHGFTGFEAAGKGADYKSGKPAADQDKDK